MKKKFPSISVCMIVKDEEENLPRLLAVYQEVSRTR